MISPKNVLFDFDGTLVDSGVLHERAFQQALGLHMPSLLSGFDYDRIRGLSTRDAFCRLGISGQPLLTELTKCKQTLYLSSIETGALNLMAGAERLMRWLRTAGCGIYLVSGGSRTSIEKALRTTAILEFFSGVITSDDVSRGKPAPDGYLRCLTEYQLIPEDCLAVEDAPSGVAACRAANLPVAGVFNAAVKNLVDLWFADLDSLRVELIRRIEAK